MKLVFTSGLYLSSLRIVLLCLTVTTSLAQSQSRMGKLYDKGKYEVLKKTLAKSLSKDTINPEIHYWYSKLYLTRGLATYDIEQSYESILTSQGDYNTINDPKDLSKLMKAGIDTLTIIKQKRKIEADAYERAKSSHTEDGYNYFLNHFVGALQADSVKIFRNAVAFEKAKQLNTHDSYRSFMEAYPDAKQVPEARERFEKLYFDESTKDGKLSSYVKFLSDYPQSYYRPLAEKEIFELSTLSGDVQDYIDFINKYRKSPFVRHAMDILYHLDDSKLRYEWAPFMADSLKIINQRKRERLTPIYKLGKFGFINDKGQEIIPPSIDEIATGHKCELDSSHIIRTITKKGMTLINTLGDVIWSGNFDEVEDIGAGVLTLHHNDKVGAIHKSGRPILPIRYDEIKLVSNRIISYKNKDKWGLISLVGKSIAPAVFDEIIGLEEYLLLTKNDKTGILRYSAVQGVANGKPLKPNGYFNEWELLDNGDMLVSDDVADYVFSPRLKLRFNKLVKQIEVHDSLFFTTEPNGKRVYDSRYELLAGSYENLKYNKSVIAYQQKDEWHIMSDSLKNSYDSLTIISDKIAVGHHGGTSFFVFDKSHSVEVPENVQYRILKNIKSIGLSLTEYLLVSNEDNYHYIYNESSQLIYEGPADKFEVIGTNLIIIEQDGLKGIINGKGKKVIPAEYEAIGNYKNGVVSLLSESQFGLYRVSDSTLLPAEYDKQLTSYNQGFFIAHKPEGYGLVNRHNETVIPFEFEEIQYWNDSAAFIKKDYDWKLYNLRTNEIIQEHIKGFEIISSSNNEQIARVLRDNYFGLMSSTKGQLIPAVYQDIINLGTVDSPFYLAEKNIEEADFYVTIYYSAEGDIVYKQAYEAHDYDKIYCERN